MVVEAAVFPGRYLSITSYRRDGTAVATPVWFVERDGALLIQTDAESFKVRRIRANPAVSIAPCSVRGALRGDPVPAHAVLLDEAELPGVEALLKRKYRLDMLVFGPLRWLQATFRLGRARRPTVALAIRPD